MTSEVIIEANESRIVAIVFSLHEVECKHQREGNT